MNQTIRWLLVAVLGMALGGCGKQAPSGTAAGAAAGATDLSAVLAKADAADGSTDKVVSKCPTCMLSMPGKAEFTVMCEGYSVHMCSQHCKEAFAKDPPKALLALKFPAKPAAKTPEKKSP